MPLSSLFSCLNFPSVLGLKVCVYHCVWLVFLGGLCYSPHIALNLIIASLCNMISFLCSSCVLLGNMMIYVTTKVQPIGKIVIINEKILFTYSQLQGAMDLYNFLILCY